MCSWQVSKLIRFESTENLLPCSTMNTDLQKKNWCDRQCKRFHQDVKEIQTRYLGMWDISITVDYCWSLMKNGRDALSSRTTLKRKFPLRKCLNLFCLQIVCLDSCFIDTTARFCTDFDTFCKTVTMFFFSLQTLQL